MCDSVLLTPNSLGQNLANLEGVYCIIQILRRFNVKMVPGQVVCTDVSLTNPLKYGLKVVVERV